MKSFASSLLLVILALTASSLPAFASDAASLPQPKPGSDEILLARKTLWRQAWELSELRSWAATPTTLYKHETEIKRAVLQVQTLAGRFHLEDEVSSELAEIHSLLTAPRAGRALPSASDCWAKLQAITREIDARAGKAEGVVADSHGSIKALAVGAVALVAGVAVPSASAKTGEHQVGEKALTELAPFAGSKASLLLGDLRRATGEAETDQVLKNYEIPAADWGAIKKIKAQSAAAN